MIFANATYLWGLLGLLLPIAIHLWSRKKVKTIKVGSTKLLQASEPKQTSSIKLNELLLLFLRLLIIFLLVFILAVPSISKTEKNVAINYVIEPSLLNEDRMSSMLDTIPKESVRILENGFPSWDEYEDKEFPKSPFYWQLAQQIHSIASDSIVVFSKGFMKGVKGKRPTIKANTRWITFEQNTAAQKTLEVTHKESYVEVLSSSGDGSILSFKKDTISLDSDLIVMNTSKDSIRLKSSNSKSWLALQRNTPIQIGIVNNDSLQEQIRYFKAAYHGISKFLNRHVEIEILNSLDDVSDYDFDTLISFDTLAVTSEATILMYSPDEFADELIEKGPTRNIFHLTKLLDSENIVYEHLPERLLRLLDLNIDLEEIIKSNDLRTLAENELQPLKSEEKLLKNTAGIFQLTPWLWMLFILVVVLERILSKLRKQ